MRRRLIFAQALLGSPRLLVLDEPTSELDRDTAGQVMAALLGRAADAVIVMTTHLAEEATAHARQVLRMDEGRASVAAEAR